MLEHGVACVTVGFPATGLTGGRVRFCLSAAHSREMLDKVSRSFINIFLIIFQIFNIFIVITKTKRP